MTTAADILENAAALTKRYAKVIRIDCVTPESIAAAKAAADRERGQIERLTGGRILDDGRIVDPQR